MNIVCGRMLGLTAWLGLLIGSVVGCAPSDIPEGMPELHPVTLTIVQSGTPLEGATIQLVPQDSANSRWACGGTSDATGKVVVQTLGKFPGAPVGSYKATIYKTLVEDMTPGVEDSPSSTKVFETFLLVDPKFQSAETSTIEVTVASGENNPPPIDLGAPVKIKQKQP